MKRLIRITLISMSITSYAQQNVEEEKPRPFVAYDFGQAIFNKFQSLSGEVGLRLPNRHLIRLVHMNVEFTEAHLSSDFAVTVNGDDVEGSMLGFEAFYSFPTLRWREDKTIVYISPSVGYYTNKYWHTVLDERFEKSSPTIGTEISFRETNILGVNGLYYSVTIPFRLHFDPHEKFKLGETTVSGNRLDSNIWFFIGYEF